MVEKVSLGTMPLIYPIPIVLVGCKANGQVNFATFGDVGLMGINPPLLFLSSHRDHLTTDLIKEAGIFSINIPDTNLLEKTDTCGIASGREMDKAALFEVFYGSVEQAPLISECPVNIICQVVHQFAIQHRQLFIGQVVETLIDKDRVVEEDGKLRPKGLEALDPIFYALDNRYYRSGPAIGIGYQTGKRQ
ncbi:MAG TPA: flavin reductase family protein [Anaerolineaceae bacterium]|nr:flavin reductase family protein [Anaerolineaceae bacterium]HPN50207.1 flavin reductase family protein [Anaerolineaceae bacterium]